MFRGHPVATLDNQGLRTHFAKTFLSLYKITHFINAKTPEIIATTESNTSRVFCQPPGARKSIVQNSFPFFNIS